MFGNNGQELGTKDRAASLNKTDYKEITVQPPVPKRVKDSTDWGGAPGYRAAGQRQ